MVSECNNSGAALPNSLQSLPTVTADLSLKIGYSLLGRVRVSSILGTIPASPLSYSGIGLFDMCPTSKSKCRVGS